MCDITIDLQSIDITHSKILQTIASNASVFFGFGSCHLFFFETNVENKLSHFDLDIISEIKEAARRECVIHFSVISAQKQALLLVVSVNNFSSKTLQKKKYSNLSVCYFECFFSFISPQYEIRV